MTAVQTYAATAALQVLQASIASPDPDAAVEVDPWGGDRTGRAPYVRVYFDRWLWRCLMGQATRPDVDRLRSVLDRLADRAAATTSAESVGPVDTNLQDHLDHLDHLVGTGGPDE